MAQPWMLRVAHPGPRYPIVRCDAHPGEDEPGYIVCKHVLGGDPVADFQPATVDDVGIAACAACCREGAQASRSFILCCAHSVRDAGFDKLKTRVQ